MGVIWGVLGAGSVAQRRVMPTMGELDGHEIGGLMVRDIARAKELAHSFGAARAYDDADALIADENVNAVYVSSPVYVHREHVLAAARAGKHVLCEKPMGMTEAECEEMIAACSEANVALQVCFVLRGWEIYQRIGAMIQEGRIGQVVELRAHLAKWTPREADEWRLDAKRAGGGTLVDVASHYIDLFRYLNGDLVRVAYMPGASIFGWPVEETAHLLVEFENGAHGAITASTTIRHAGNLLEVYGTDGTILVGGGKLRVIGEAGEDVEDAVFPDYYSGLLKNFADCVDGKAEPIAPGREGLANVRVTEAAYRSDREGSYVRVG